MPKVGELVYRDLRQRNFEDQKRAQQEGYTGVLQMAVNELGKRVIELEARMKAAEEMLGITAIYEITDGDPED